MILIRLKKTSRNMWQIINRENNVLISERQMPNEHKALEWCKIFMSSFADTFEIEVENNE